MNEIPEMKPILFMTKRVNKGTGKVILVADRNFPLGKAFSTRRDENEKKNLRFGSAVGHSRPDPRRLRRGKGSLRREKPGLRRSGEADHGGGPLRRRRRLGSDRPLPRQGADRNQAGGATDHRGKQTRGRRGGLFGGIRDRGQEQFLHAVCQLPAPFDQQPEKGRQQSLRFQGHDAAGPVDPGLRCHRGAKEFQIPGHSVPRRRFEKGSEARHAGGRPAPGSMDHLIAVLPAYKSGIDPKKLKYVSYDGGGEAIAALLGGNADAIATDASAVGEYVKAGKVRVLAVTSPKRMGGILKDVPTLKEEGIDAEFTIWRGVFGPKQMPDEVKRFWDEKLKALQESEEWQKELEKNNWESEYRNSRDFAAFLEEQEQQIRELLESMGMAK